MSVNKNNKLRLKVVQVPPNSTKGDVVIDLMTEEVFIYRIEVVGKYAYIFYDDRKFK